MGAVALGVAGAVDTTGGEAGEFGSVLGGVLGGALGTRDGTLGLETPGLGTVGLGTVGLGTVGLGELGEGEDPDGLGVPVTGTAGGCFGPGPAEFDIDTAPTTTAAINTIADTNATTAG